MVCISWPGWRGQPRSGSPPWSHRTPTTGPVPLVALAGLAVGLLVAGVVAAQRRDVGAGLVALRTRRTPQTGLLGSVLGFAIRRSIRPTVGWVIGIAAYYLLLGALIASVLEFFDSNLRFADLAASAGFGGLNSANGFAAALFALLSIATGLYAATRLAGMVADERARRWTPVLSAPVSRIHLACTEIAVVTAGVLVLHVVAALAIWTGTAITGAPFTLGAALAGALNSVPIAWLAVGASAFALGWLPSAVGRDRRIASRGRVPDERCQSERRRPAVGDEAVAIRAPRRRAQCAAGPCGDRCVHADRRHSGGCWRRRVFTSRPDDMKEQTLSNTTVWC